VLAEVDWPDALTTLDAIQQALGQLVEWGAENRLGLSAVLVRPDGYVAWPSDTTASLADAARAAARWFGEPSHKKRVYRWYRMEGPQICMRIRRRKHMCVHRGIVPQARRTHERWSMDFVHDQLFDGRAFRMLTLIDQFSRQTPLLEPRFSFCGRDVVAALDRAVEQAGTPVSITVDHGTQFTSKALED
jgi:hypothetical protein